MNGELKKNHQKILVSDLEVTNVQEPYALTCVENHILFKLSFNLEILFMLVTI